MGRRSIVDKSFAYTTKGPGFESCWRILITLCIYMFCKRIVIHKRAPIGANLKKIKQLGVASVKMDVYGWGSDYWASVIWYLGPCSDQTSCYWERIVKKC